MSATPFVSRRPHAGPCRARQDGVGLVEVLISVLILAIGMLGIAAMQAMALRYGQSSLESSQAVMQTYSITEAMRANAANAAAYNTAGMVCTAPAAGTLAATDMHEWIGSIKASMGADACGRIQGCPLACVITVQWDDSRAKDGAVASSDVRQISTQTTI